MLTSGEPKPASDFVKYHIYGFDKLLFSVYNFHLEWEVSVVFINVSNNLSLDLTWTVFLSIWSVYEVHMKKCIWSSAYEVLNKEKIIPFSEMKLLFDFFLVNFWVTLNYCI